MLVNKFLEQSAKRFSNKMALISQNKRASFLELEQAANSLANALIFYGLQKQDRVAIYLENSVESVVSLFGALKASGVFVIIHPQVKAKKLQYILNDCQAKILITDERHLEEVSQTILHCSELATILVTDEYSRNNPTLVSFNEALQHPTSCPRSNCISIDLASLIYTSGSTGNPKGVMLTHQNMVTAANSIITYLENTSQDIILNCLPLSFDYGLYQILMAIKFGGTAFLEKSFLYPYQIIDVIVKEKITGFPLVPAIAAILLKLKNLDSYDFSKLRYITSTAQTLPVKHIVRLQEIFPKTKIYSMYGLTECKRATYLPPGELSKRPTSVGKAIPDTEVYLVNEVGERITNPGEIGELVVRGANVMKGYWNRPEETAKKLKQGDYPGEKNLFTGDLFKMDDENYLYFVARKDDMIKTAGGLVSPKEVENVLYEIDDVLEAGVVGVPDKIVGQAIKAVVSLREGSSISKKGILLQCSKHLEQFMIPKYVEIHQQLPKTPSGKIHLKYLAETTGV